MQSTRKGAFDLEDEVGIVPEAIGLTFDDLDLVVHAFEAGGVDRVAAVVEDPRFVTPEVASEGDQGRDAARLSEAAPLFERLAGPAEAAVAPDPFELVFEDVNGVQRLVGGQQLPQPGAFIGPELRLVLEQEVAAALDQLAPRPGLLPGRSPAPCPGPRPRSRRAARG